MPAVDRYCKNSVFNLLTRDYIKQASCPHALRHGVELRGFRTKVLRIMTINSEKITSRIL